MTPARSKLLFTLSLIAGASGTLGFISPCSAWEFRCRFVERTGNVDTPISNNFLDASSGTPRRIRIQFGVFDDANGPAPDGGFVGWNAGAISVSGQENNSNETRTPGRINPYAFVANPNSNGNPPRPDGDPFTMLTEIDATLGTQSPFWNCDANGDPLPMPGPVVRGRNTFSSVYEITIDPNGFQDYTITYSGNLIAANEWRIVGTPILPDCDHPSTPEGSVLYAPLTAAPQAFSCVLSVHVIPSPSAAILGFTGVLTAFGVRRRR